MPSRNVIVASPLTQSVLQGNAQNVNARLQSLINDLNTALVSPSADVTAQINADWANANTARLRTDLGLPQSTCNFLTAT